MTKTKTTSNLLDTPIFELLHINLEVFLYILLGVVAVAACFYNLGARTQSHDESLHALYSWKLYAGDGYEHNPMMHGPFLFHTNALFYFLFGTSDFTARMSAAVFGVILVLLPAFLRKELGRVGALAVSALTLISPSTLYHARYIRNDIYMMVWAMLMAIALFRYLDSRQPKWLYLGGLAVTMSLCTKETAYITGFIGFTFLAIVYIQQMFTPRAARMTYVIGVALLIVLAIIAISMNANMPEQAPGGEEAGDQVGRTKKLIEVLVLLIGILIAMLLGSLLIKQDGRIRPALTLAASYLAAMVMLVLICTAVGGAIWLAFAQLPEGILDPKTFVALQVVLVGLGVGAGGYGWWRLLQHARTRTWLPTGFQDRVLYITLLLVVVPFVLLYTTFFTNPKGLGTGTFGAISYWLAQQEVKRAGQPWFYYLVIAPLYDFTPIGFGLLAILYYLVTGRTDRPRVEAPVKEPQPGRRDAGDLTPSRHVECLETRSLFVAYAVYWALAAWLLYSWAGEKMPWLMVHIAQPMIVLSGRFVDDVVYGVDWPQVWRKGGAVLALLTPILLLALGMLIGLPLFGQAFKGLSLGDINDTSRWLFALVIGSGLSFAAVQIRGRIGSAATRRVVFLSLLLLASLFTLRYAWMACYINYDTAQEFLVYAHSTPDVKQTVEEIKEISRRLYGDERAIKLAYSSDATWPFEWYFETGFPNRVFFGKEPSRESTDAPILVIGRAEIAATEPFLGKRYHRFDRKLIWWPHQDYYMGLSLRVPPTEKRDPTKNYFLLDMRDPQKRREFLDVLFYRQYKQSLADWEPSHTFAFYVRKDIAAQLWDLGVAPSVMELDVGEEVYEKGRKPVSVASVLGGRGAGDGQFDSPRNVAIGPHGALYVADSGNHRIQKLAPDGTFLAAWGHMCKMYENLDGCQQASGAGGFYDPWGIAVDADGFVYVADTWNHRIQKFTADGAYVTQWGQYGLAETGGPGLFWGPREVAISPDGLIYVSDTGNKRIQVFTPDGEYVTQWGGKGVTAGQFDEPVGMAVSLSTTGDGQTYVADTWNQRIQAFDASHFFTHMWEIDSWYGQSLQNKPYLAVDAQGRVYATDPEAARILVFDGAGKFLLSLDGRRQAYGTGEGQDSPGFVLPTGIAVDAQGYVYVADPGAHQVVKLMPVAWADVE